MRSMLFLIAGMLVGLGCASQARDPEPVMIRYCAEPPRTFELDGQPAGSLAGLREALLRHQREHPTATYEVYAEVKAVPEESDRVIDSIREAGVTLVHYWAPSSDPSAGTVHGRYGLGFIDLMDR